MKNLILVLFVFVAGCQSQDLGQKDPGNILFTTDKLYGCKLTSEKCPGQAPCCEAFDSCRGNEPGGAKGQVVLERASIQDGRLICQWRFK